MHVYRTLVEDAKKRANCSELLKHPFLRTQSLTEVRAQTAAAAAECVESGELGGMKGRQVSSDLVYTPNSDYYKVLGQDTVGMHHRRTSSSSTTVVTNNNLHGNGGLDMLEEGSKESADASDYHHQAVASNAISVPVHANSYSRSMQFDDSLLTDLSNASTQQVYDDDFEPNIGTSVGSLGASMEGGRGRIDSMDITPNMHHDSDPKTITSEFNHKSPNSCRENSPSKLIGEESYQRLLDSHEKLHANQRLNVEGEGEKVDFQSNCKGASQHRPEGREGDGSTYASLFAQFD